MSVTLRFHFSSGIPFLHSEYRLTQEAEPVGGHGQVGLHLGLQPLGPAAVLPAARAVHRDTLLQLGKTQSVQPHRLRTGACGCVRSRDNTPALGKKILRRGKR